MALGLKICGMRDPYNVMAVARHLPDWMGFIFYERSPRFVGTEFAVPPGLPRQVSGVGVFVNEDIAVVLDALRKNSMVWAQLHGDESKEYCAKLREQGVRVIKAFGVGGAFDFRSTEPYFDVVDYFLFDTKSDVHGGTGITFDWEKLDLYTGSKGFLLSGGLGVSNLYKALSIQHPMLMGLDFNSGVESKPGVKNEELVKEVIRKVKRHNEGL